MELIKAEVDWMEQWENPPRLVLTVDAVPDRSSLRWRRSRVDPCCFYAEDGGYASFLFGDPLKPGDGFYGRAFDLKMADGQVVRLLGPMSGRASLVNATAFGPVLDVILNVRSEFEVCRHAVAGAVTLGFARRAAHSIGVPLAEWFDPDRPEETMWVPVGGPVRRCSICLRRLRDGRCLAKEHDVAPDALGWTWPEPVA